jgi:hypothetical protein
MLEPLRNNSIIILLKEFLEIITKLDLLQYSIITINAETLFVIVLREWSVNISTSSPKLNSLFVVVSSLIDQSSDNCTAYHHHQGRMTAKASMFRSIVQARKTCRRFQPGRRIPDAVLKDVFESTMVR